MRFLLNDFEISAELDKANNPQFPEIRHRKVFLSINDCEGVYNNTSFWRFFVCKGVRQKQLMYDKTRLPLTFGLLRAKRESISNGDQREMT